jgi:hypothetical protein
MEGNNVIASTHAYDYEMVSFFSDGDTETYTITSLKENLLEEPLLY